MTTKPPNEDVEYGRFEARPPSPPIVGSLRWYRRTVGELVGTLENLEAAAGHPRSNPSGLDLARREARELLTRIKRELS